MGVRRLPHEPMMAHNRWDCNRFSVESLGTYMGDRLRGAKWGNKPEPWNHTASSTGTLVSCAWEYRPHQLARPVGIPYAGSNRGALV